MLEGRSGADFLNGLQGDDWAVYTGAPGVVIVDLLFPAANRGDAFGDTLMSIERLGGSGFGDHLGGDHGANTIHGIDGNDFLAGRGGNDQLSGGEHNDTLVGDGGTDTLLGGSGNDMASYEASPIGVRADLLLWHLNTGEAFADSYTSIEMLLGSRWADTLGGDHAANTLYGWDGDDVMNGRGGADRVQGDDFADTLRGEAGNDTLLGGPGDDWMDGGADFDLMVGGTGADIFHVNSDLDAVREAAGEGYDRVYATGHFTLHRTLTEVEELRARTPNALLNLVLTGSATPNLIVGDAGNNRLDGRDGADTLRGLLGADTYIADDSGDRVFDVDSPGLDLVLAAVTFTLGAFLERLTLTGTAAIDGTGNGLNNTLIGNNAENILTGGAGEDSLVGRDGDDTLQGGEGNDTLRGEAGADSLVGGNGIDLMDFFTATAAVALDLAGFGTVGEPIGDRFLGIERVHGSAFGDTVTGDAGANLLRGIGGDDWLDGGTGADTLHGGDGEDRLFADSDDVVNGGLGLDIVTAQTTTIPAGFVFTVLPSQSVERVSGNNGHDRIDASAMTIGVVLTGFDGGDTMTGGSGDDGLTGMIGNDSLSGGLGFDQLNGGEGNDTMVGGGGPQDSLFGGNGNDSLVGTGPGRLTGDAGNDTLMGGPGDHLLGLADNDSLIGAGGAEQIDGGAGADTLTGGAGTDLFDFQDGWGDDVITDFQKTLDRLDFSEITGLDSFDELVRAQDAGGARVGFGGWSILLLGLVPDDIIAADVLI